MVSFHCREASLRMTFREERLNTAVCAGKEGKEFSRLGTRGNILDCYMVELRGIFSSLLEML